MLRHKDFPYPHSFRDVEEVNAWARKFHTSISEEMSERTEDFDILKLSNVPWIDVREFGAKLDGSTDDATALQAAVTESGSSDIGILIPRNVNLLVGSAIAVTNNLRMMGLDGAIIDGGNTAGVTFEIGANVSVIDIRGIKFNQFAASVLSSDTTARTLSQFTFLYNIVENSSKGIYLACKVQKAMVSKNRFSALSCVGGACNAIQLGTNVYAQQDDMKKLIVTDNEIYDLESDTNDKEVHGIIVEGREAIISGNIIHGIVNSGNGVNAEGIYTKCRYGTITNNILIDAGTGSASIDIKGDARGVTTAPQGFCTVCTGNTLYSSDGAYTGIHIAAEDVIVSNNVLEGFGLYGIWSDIARNNIKISSNTIKNHRGTIGIYIENYGEVYSINDNHIYGLLASQGTITDAYGIFVNPASAGDMESLSINGNIIRSDTDDSSGATSSVRGIQVAVTNNAIYDMSIQNNNITIQHASVDEHGIDLAYTTAGTIDKFQIKNNLCRDVGTYPLKIDGALTLTNFDIDASEAWGQIDSAVDYAIEIYHNKCIFTNSGATTARTFTLPAAIKGLKYSFVTVTDKDLHIDPDGTDTIGSTGAGVARTLTQHHESMELECTVAGEWEVVGGSYITPVNNHVRVTAPEWKQGATAPTADFVGIAPVWKFGKATDDEVHYSIIVPYRIETGSTINVNVDWTYTGTQDNGTVCWKLEYINVASGEAVDGTTATITATSAGTHTTGTLIRTNLLVGITGAVAHDDLMLRLWRDSSEDTLDTTADLVQVHFEFVRDKHGEAI